METKITLSGKFSNYELICDVYGKIMCRNLKDDTTQHICTFDPTYIHASFKTERYKNLKKWIERKVKLLNETKSRRALNPAEKSEMINTFYFALKTEVREYKLKDLN